MAPADGATARPCAEHKILQQMLGTYLVATDQQQMHAALWNDVHLVDRLPLPLTVYRYAVLATSVSIWQ
jgi:hypothetical protein